MVSGVYVRRFLRGNRRRIKLLAQSFLISAIFVFGWTVYIFPSPAEEHLVRETNAALQYGSKQLRPKIDLPVELATEHRRAGVASKTFYGDRDGFFNSPYGVSYCKPTIHFLMVASKAAPNNFLWERWFEDIKDTLSYSVHVHCSHGKDLCSRTIRKGRLHDKLVETVDHDNCIDANHIVQMLKTALVESKMHKSFCDEPVEDRYIVVDAAAIPLMPFSEMYPILTKAQSGFCIQKQEEWLSAAWKTGSKNDWVPKADRFFMLTETEAKAMTLSHQRNLWKTLCNRGDCCVQDFWPFVASHGVVSAGEGDTKYSTSKYMGNDMPSKWIDRSTAKKNEQGLCKHTFAPTINGDLSATDFAKHVGVAYEPSFGNGNTYTGAQGVYYNASPTTWKILAKSRYLFTGAIFGLESTDYLEDVQRILFKSEYVQKPNRRVKSN